jgi:hypothetical protein
MAGDFYRTQGPVVALKRVGASLRALRHRRLLDQMADQGYLAHAQLRRGQEPGLPWDPLHFISHTDYLVKSLSLERRFEAALAHQRIEAALLAPALIQKMYSAEGVRLWEAEVEGHRFSLEIGLPGLELLEGDLRMRLIADGRGIGTVNFVWADAAMFGARSRPTIFITRNQTHMWPELDMFRTHFKQNSPPYFGIAALSGIALACGMNELYAVQHQHQVTFDGTYATSYFRSYDEFWEKFSAERATPFAFRLEVPLKLRDLSELKSKHRSRAESRRRAWGEVAQSASELMAAHLRRGAAAGVPAAMPAVAAEAAAGSPSA